MKFQDGELSDKFLTRFYECGSISQKMATAVDAFVTAAPEEKEQAEELLRRVYSDIASTPSRVLRKKVTK
jgi:hypothetical protein